MEKIVETKNCKICSAKFDITDKDLEFYEKISPVFNSEKYLIPSPTLCPDCRYQRRLSFRNERNLYKRKCDATGKSIISMFSPDKKNKVYAFNEWFSDKWNPFDYGQEFDFNRSFFEQFGELKKNVPSIAMIGVGNENSEYTNYAGYNKDCYLCFDYGMNSECSYISKSYNNKLCLDILYSLKCENSFDLLDCIECYNCINCILCENCSDCNFCYNCKSSSNCFLSFNLINKSYHILNKAYSKEEYFIEIEKLKNQYSYEELKKQFIQKIAKTIKKANSNLSSDNVTGNYLKECKDCYESYDAQKCQNSKFIINSIGLNDSYDDMFSGPENNSMNLETIGCERPNYNRFCISCWQGNRDIFYCDFCHACENIFGCIGFRNIKYCILNKQYTEEEYNSLVPKIIEHMKKTGEWGEFFPISISLFGYNETVANEYYPLSKEEAIKKGFNWSDYENPIPSVDKIIPASKLPDDIESIPDDIINWAIKCDVTGKPFRIVKSELDFYRKNKLPIPRLHPDERHLERMKLRNLMKLFDRKCTKCGVDIKTSYSPERPEIVYCEDCFNKEII